MNARSDGWRRTVRTATRPDQVLKIHWTGRPTQDQVYSIAYLSKAEWNDTRFFREDFDKLIAVNVRGLFVTGGNPLTAFPDPDRLRAALARLDVLAVVDVAEGPLTELATHVLPSFF